MISESVASVKPCCVLISADQRFLCAGENRDVGSAQLDGIEGITRGLFHIDVPATTVIAATRTSGSRKAMIRATASSDAVSVSIRKVRGTGVSIANASNVRQACDQQQSSVELLVFQGSRMFTPPSLTVALLMMIASAICWGSWANTYKGVKNYRFELFYWDYAIGIFLISLILRSRWEAAGMTRPVL